MTYYFANRGENIFKPYVQSKNNENIPAEIQTVTCSKSNIKTASGITFLL